MRGPLSQSDPDLDQKGQQRDPRGAMVGARSSIAVAVSGLAQRLGRRRILIIIGYIVAILIAAPLWIYPAIPPPIVRSGAAATQNASVTSSVAPTPTAPPAPTQPSALRLVGADDFERSVADGWGTALIGGPYSVAGSMVPWNVSAGAGHVVIPTPASRWGAYLPGVGARDVRVGWTISTDRLPSGGELFVYGELRRTAGGAAYRAGVRISPDGKVYAHAGLVIRDREASLGNDVMVPDLVTAPGSVINVRAQAMGVDPTNIRVRVWAHDQPEPEDWSIDVLDWTGLLQGPGAVGVGCYLGAKLTNAPVALAFDDLAVTTTDAAVGALKVAGVVPAQERSAPSWDRQDGLSPPRVARR